MAKPTTRQELIDYCFRKLGHPVSKINVEASQADDRIDEALETYVEKHYDATEHIWVTYPLTQADIDSGYIQLPSDILSVTQMLPLNSVFANGDMFDFRYQLSINELSPFKPFDQISYFMNMTNYQQIMDMTSATPTFNFVRHGNKVKPYQDLSQLGVDYPFAMKVFKIIDPDVATSMYNDKWLKEYATALIKRQWGENLKKLGGVQMLGGVTLNGKEIFDEALEEIRELEETLENTYMLPVDFFIG